MSPEGAVTAMEHYLEELQAESEVAFHFFQGHMMEALDGFYSLPEESQTQIDQLIWEKTAGAMVDLADPKVAPFMASAILSHLEQRMGFD